VSWLLLVVLCSQSWLSCFVCFVASSCLQAHLLHRCSCKSSKSDKASYSTIIFEAFLLRALDVACTWRFYVLQ